MADKVKAVVEAMMWDLRSLEKKEIFSTQEVKAIVAKREDFEYRMNKNTSTDVDFLTAIQYEMELEELRKERYSELKLKRTTGRDFSVIKRICFLFDRLCAKFKYRPDLWREYLRFCLEIGSKKNFYRAFSNSIRFNASALPLWLISVYFEFELNSNPFKARQIFLRAIKLNTSQIEVWLEYFRFECKFIKLIEKREAFLEGAEKPQKEPAAEDEEEGEGFLAFNDEDTPNPLIRDLLESSDEEGPTKEERLDLEKKKSNHTLLLVIFESIRENFSEKMNLANYQKLLKVLREEKHGSQEVGLALLRVTDEVLADENLSAEDKAVLRFCSKGIYDKAASLGDEAQAERVESKIIKALEEAEPKYLGLHALAAAPAHVVVLINKSPRILKKVNQLFKSDLPYETLLLVLKQFRVKVTDKAREMLEARKFEEGSLDAYLRSGLADSSNHERVKYLEEFTKKNSEAFKLGISSVQKLEVTKKLISVVIEYLKEKDFNEEDQTGKYKYIGQYLKVLLAMTKLNVELVDFLGKCLIEQWVDQAPHDSSLITTIGDTFWHLKKQCPARIFAFLLERSSTFNKPQHFELAIQCHPGDLPLWKLRIRLAKTQNDLPELNSLYERGLQSFKATEERNQFHNIYQQIVN